MNHETMAVTGSMPMPTCWVVTDGKTGTENQCVGLANALGLKPEIKRVQLRAPWRWLTPYLKAFSNLAFSRRGDQPQAPWPDILITCGRRSLPAVFAARQAMGGKVFIIHLQDPKCSLKWFDLVVAPHHDQLAGKNVISTLGALNKITPELTAAAAQAQIKRFSGLPHPLTALLLGGSSNTYHFDEGQMKALIEKLEQMLWKTPGSLIITPSRRTGDKAVAMLRARIGNHPRVWIWDMVSENPYLAMLEIADNIMVTADSTSMLSEAATTGKPIYVIPLHGGSKRSMRFHANFMRAGITRPFSGQLDYWDYEPLRETQSVANYVKRMLKERYANDGKY